MSRYASQSARSVFVGNIPYNATDEELEEVFRTVGSVVSLRLVKNPDGQPKVLPDAPQTPFLTTLPLPPSSTRHSLRRVMFLADGLVDACPLCGRLVLNISISRASDSPSSRIRKRPKAPFAISTTMR